MEPLLSFFTHSLPLWIGRASLVALAFYAVMYVLFLNVEDE